MKAAVRAAKSRFELCAVTEFSFAPLEFRPGQTPQIGSPSQQSFHLMPRQAQLMHQVCPNESRSAGNETFHPTMIVEAWDGSTPIFLLRPSQKIGNGETRVSFDRPRRVFTDIRALDL